MSEMRMNCSDIALISQFETTFKPLCLVSLVSERSNVEFITSAINIQTASLRHLRGYSTVEINPINE